MSEPMKPSAEIERIAELEKLEPWANGGDLQSQARAWRVVRRVLCEAGLQEFCDKNPPTGPRTGMSEAVIFIDHLAAQRAEMDGLLKSNASLQAALADPPPDVQEAVIRKLDLVSRDALDGLAAALKACKVELERLEQFTPSAEALKAIKQANAALKGEHVENPLVERLAAALREIVKAWDKNQPPSREMIEQANAALGATEKLK